MSVVAALGPFLALILAVAGVEAATAVERFQSDGWLLTVRPDQFTGRTACALTSTDSRLQYQPGAIGFRIGERRDALSSWYRVDGGSPVRWQDRTAALTGAGVTIEGPGLDDPTGGWVWIPVTEVGRSRDVAVRPGDRGHIKHFRVSGFAPMFDASRRLGCNSYDLPRF